MNVKLKRLLLPLLRAAAKGATPTFRMRSAASQALFLIGKPTAKKVQGRLRREQQRTSARQSHNQETARIYTAVRERSGGFCECGCGVPFFASIQDHTPEMDHFHGRAKGQSVETCWRLISIHHRMKTENNPSREFWDRLFAAHCAKYGYPFKGRLIHADPAKAGGAP